MKKTVLFSLVVSLFAFSANAQVKYNGGAGEFYGGYYNIDVDDLQVFIPNRFEDISPNFGLFGGRGYVVVNNWRIGGGGSGYANARQNDASLTMQATGGMGYGELSYMFFYKEKAAIYPLFGFGGGGLEIEVTNRQSLRPEELTGNNAQGDTDRDLGFNSYRASHSSLLAKIALGAQIYTFTEWDEEEQAFGGLLLGIEAGYIAGIANSEWEHSGGEILGGPNFGRNSFYITLNIGFGGFQRQTKEEDMGEVVPNGQ